MYDDDDDAGIFLGIRHAKLGGAHRPAESAQPNIASRSAWTERLESQRRQ